MPPPGNDLFVAYGSNGQDLALQVLQRMALADRIPRGAKVGIKPNLVVAKPSSSGATTDPAIVEAIIAYLLAANITDIVMLESSWVGASTETAFDVCGYTALAKKYGIALWNLEHDESVPVRVENEIVRICKRATRVDFLINVPVLKAHCQTRLTCALKNLKGCIPHGEKRRFHTEGLHRPIAALARALPIGAVIVDGINGDLTFEEGGNPVAMNRVLGGYDPVLMDAYAATLLGYAPEDIAYIGLAAALGVGRDRLEEANIIEVNDVTTTPLFLADQTPGRTLTRHICPREACSPCYASVIHALQRLTDDGIIHKLGSPIAVGQGYQGCDGPGPGIGDCAQGLREYLPGCPPDARAVDHFLRGIIRRR